MVSSEKEPDSSTGPNKYRAVLAQSPGARFVISGKLKVPSTTSVLYFDIRIWDAETAHERKVDGKFSAFNGYPAAKKALEMMSQAGLKIPAPTTRVRAPNLKPAGRRTSGFPAPARVLTGPTRPRGRSSAAFFAETGGLASRTSHFARRSGPPGLVLVPDTYCHNLSYRGRHNRRARGSVYAFPQPENACPPEAARAFGARFVLSMTSEGPKDRNTSQVQIKIWDAQTTKETTVPGGPFSGGETYKAAKNAV